MPGVTDSIALYAAVIALVGLLWQMYQANRQARLQNFTAYTERYENIMLNLPVAIEAASFDFEGLDNGEREQILRWLRTYYDLCSEEYYLWQAGFVDKVVWRLWEDGMVQSFRKPAFRRAWAVYKQYQYFGAEFTRFVENAGGGDTIPNNSVEEGSVGSGFHK